jgi:hypothetical protein
MSKNSENGAAASDASTPQANVANSYKKEVKTVNVNDLMLHPKLEGLYSPTEPEQTGFLLSNIHERGLINKIVITPQLEILSGKRRWGAVQRLAVTLQI